MEVVYTVEAWSVVGFMVWGLRMVWIYGFKRHLKEVNKLNTASYKFLVFLTPWSRKNKVPEIVFCGRVRIGGVFCMCFINQKNDIGRVYRHLGSQI